MIQNKSHGPIVGFTAGILMTLLGLFLAIPRTGLFGVVWTLIVVLITAIHGHRLFKKPDNQEES